MSFRRPSRKRRVAKQIGLTLCLLIGVAWMASLIWTVRYSGPYVSFGVRRGGCMVGLSHDRLRGYSGWKFTRAVGYRHSYLPAFRVGSTGGYSIIIPFWISVLVVGVPTFSLWRNDRRSPEGHCQNCGYDLTGNESGVCPECGKAI